MLASQHTNNYSPLFAEISDGAALTICLGWDQLLLGQFVLEWRDLHNQYLTSKHEGTKVYSSQT